MNSRVRTILIVVVLVVIAGFSISRLTAESKPKTEVGRTVEAKPGALRVTVSESGTLEPVTQVEVKSRVAGRVLQIFVKEGDQVKTGDPIALIDPTEVARDVERIKAQLAAAEARLRQNEENYALAKRQVQFNIARAEAAYREARTRLTQASAPTRPQEIRQAEESVERAEFALEQADANVTRAEAALQRNVAQIADAKLNLERQKALVAKGFVAQSAADTARTSLQLAEADKAAQEADLASQQVQRRSLETDLTSARQRLALLKEGPREEDIRVARAAVESSRIALLSERENAKQAELRRRDIEQSRAEVAQIENQLAQQNVQLTETRIVAPISGEIVSKSLNEGELVASATAGFAQGAVLVRIADLSKMQVRVNVNEVDVAKLKVGLPVEIKVDSLPDAKLSGTVTAIAPSSVGANQGTTSGGNQAVVRFEVKVEVSNPDPRLRPGMTAQVSIILDAHESTLVLPAEALRPGDKVVVVTGTEKAPVTAERNVKVGLRNYGEVEILSGLKAGEKVEVPKADAKDRRKINVSGPGDEGDEP